MSISEAETNEYFSKLTPEQIDFVDIFGNFEKPVKVTILSKLLKSLLKKGETDNAKTTSALLRKLRDTKADFDFTDFADLSVIVQNLDLLRDVVATEAFTKMPKVHQGSKPYERSAGIRR